MSVWRGAASARASFDAHYSWNAASADLTGDNQAAPENGSTYTTALSCSVDPQKKGV